MKVSPIPSPLPGEHLAAVQPVMRPDTADAGWRTRLNFWTGRALTEQALSTEQNNRAARLAWRGRATTPGVVAGLEVALETPSGKAIPADPKRRTLNGHYLHLSPGHGFAVTGEDVVIPRPLRVHLDHVPTLYARTEILPPDALPAPAAPAQPAVPWFRPINLGSGIVRWHKLNPRYVPWAAVLVLQPVEFLDIAGRDPLSPCPLDDSFDAFDDPRRVDAAQLLLCMLPPTWQRDELLLNQAQAPTWRNRVAALIARKEMERAARQDLLYRAPLPHEKRWAVAAAQGELFPWEYFGVPIGLVGWEPVPGAADPAPQRLFLDRAAVARPGGAARPRPRPAIRISPGDGTEPPSNAGTPAVWNARVTQFNEHLRDLLREPTFQLPPDLPPANVETTLQALAARFRFLPPAGLLPRPALRFLTTAEADVLHQNDRADTSPFFPPAYSTRAVPVTDAEMQTLLAASAPLARYDFTVAEPVCVLVPLPEEKFDPNLLVVEKPDPVFQAEVDRLVCVRQDWRQRRDHSWYRLRALQRMLAGQAAVAGRQIPVADQLEPEPWERFNSAGAGLALLPPANVPGPWSTTVTLPAAAAVSPLVSLGLRLFLDAENPSPRVELVWHTSSGDIPDTWETPPPLVVPPPVNGVAQPASLWRRYERTLAALGLPTSATVRGVTVTFTGARAALGPAYGVRAADSTDQLLWFPKQPRATSNSPQGPWTLINGPHIVAPFEPTYAPALADNTPFDVARRSFQHDTGRWIAGDGVSRIVADLTAEADRADDAISIAFDRARAQIHTIRQVLLGEHAADALLASPAVGGSIATKPGLAVAKDVAKLFPKKVAGPDVIEARNFMDVRVGAAPVAPGLAAAPLLTTGPAASAGRFGFAAAFAPLAPQHLEIRTLNIPRKFDVGVTLEAYQMSHQAVTDTLRLVARLPLPFDNTEIPEVQVRNAAGVAAPLTFTVLAKAYADIDAGRLKETAFLASIAVNNGSDAASDAAGGANASALNGTTGRVLAIGIRRNDQVVAILRRVEVFVARRRALIARGQRLIDALTAQITAAALRLGGLSGKLAEARHDMAVARALWQEELDRVNATNQRRDDLLAHAVQHLAYVRPRCIDLVRRDLPSMECLSSEELAPVPAALQSHIEPPEELDGYLTLFRQSPVRWFRALAPRLIEIDTLDRVTRLLDSAKLNATRFLAAAAPVFRPGAEAGAATYQASFALVSPLRRLTAGFAPAKLQSSWEDLRRAATDHATVGDLIDNAHGRLALSRAAAQELENIGKVATFLYNEFAAVQPGLRMQWVERYSQFDRPAPLRDVTALPGAATLSREARRRLQDYIDWLFGRVAPSEAGGVSLINDLIRICLLLASHAPVNQLILGHVPRPVPVRPGVLVPVRLLDPRLVRVGMEFHVWRDAAIVARGTVEDLRDGEASARIATVNAGTTSLDVHMRVQFQNAVPAGSAKTLSLLRA